MDLKIGDKITYEFQALKGEKVKNERIINDTADVNIYKNNKLYKILKIERPKYEVVEEKKELLTEEEKEFLKQYIKIIENLHNGKVDKIIRKEEYIWVVLKTELYYKIEIGTIFGNMKLDNEYTLQDLGLEE